MYFAQSFAAVLSLSSLVASAPTNERRDVAASVRGLKWKPRGVEKRLTIVENVNTPPPIVIVQNNNLDQIANLQTQLVEQQLASLVQTQAALTSQLQTVKDNIRVNHFKAQFPQVNCVILTVQNVVDNRAGQNGSTRYLVNQLLADNGKPESQMMVMVKDLETMTIAADQALPTNTLATAVSTPTQTPQVSNFDTNFPFGQIGQSIILPAGVAAPQVDVILADPAAIIFPNQNVFVQDAQSFVTSCAQFQQNANSFLLSNIQLFNSFEALAAAQANAIIFQNALLNAGAQLSLTPAAGVIATPTTPSTTATAAASSTVATDAAAAAPAPAPAE